MVLQNKMWGLLESLGCCQYSWKPGHSMSECFSLISNTMPDARRACLRKLADHSMIVSQKSWVCPMTFHCLLR